MRLWQTYTANDFEGCFKLHIKIKLASRSPAIIENNEIVACLSIANEIVVSIILNIRLG